jgi:hypothetical protein
MSIVIVIITAFYSFARKHIKNEPLRGQIDLALNNFNTYLSVLKDTEPSKILDKLSKFAFKVAMYSIIAFILASIIIPKHFKDNITVSISVLFGLSLLINISIDWHKKHKESVKKLFFNLQTILFLLLPSLVFWIDDLIKTNYFHNLFTMLFVVIKTDNILLIQVIWTVTFALLFYVGFWIVSVPIYFTLIVLIYSFSFLIRIIERYIDVHILDALVAILFLISIFTKLVN